MALDLNKVLSESRKNGQECECSKCLMALIEKRRSEHDVVAEQTKKKETNDHSSSVFAEVNCSGVMLDTKRKGKGIATHITDSWPCGNKVLEQASQLCSTCSIVCQQALKAFEETKSHKENSD